MLRVGIVGCGRIGAEFDDAPKLKMISTHAGAYSAVDEFDLVAVAVTKVPAKKHELH